MKRLHCAFLVSVVFGTLAAATASAQVTLQMTTSVSGGPMAMEMASTVYIKGGKMRSDVKATSNNMSILVDVPAKSQVMLNHDTKQVVDPQALMAAMPFAMGQADVSVKPNGETREVLGRTCAGFNVAVTMPMTVGDESVTMTMSGQMWAAKEGAGVAEYQAFYKAAAEAGLFTDMLSLGPQGKAAAEMQKLMVLNGIPLEQSVQVVMEGTGQMAQMMAQTGMGNMTMTMKVSAISVEPIADSVFDVPEGYTKK